MSKQVSREIFHESTNIMRSGLHFSTVNVRVKKAIAEEVNGRLIIKAGIIVGKDGTIQNNENAYGVIYQNVDCTDLQREDISVQVVIHGMVEKKKLPQEPTAEAKRVLRGILF